MPYKYLLYEKSNGIVKITINRPQVMNALSPETLNELRTAVYAAGYDTEIGVIIVTGTGRAFSAGADLQSLGNIELKNGRVGPVIDTAANSVIDAIQVVPKAVIAMVNGHCYTGALEIVLGCDIIIASEEARFGDTHVRWGIRPSWGMSQRLPRAVGYYKAKELSFTAGVIDGREAERIGLSNKTVPAAQLESTVQEMAQKILANSLQAVAAYKQLYNQTMRDTMEKGLEFERTSEFNITDTQSRIDGFKKKK
jgi:enoyl-CoA hydratase/carnithine racemase